MPTSTVALFAPGLDVMLSNANAMATKTASVSYSFDPTPIATTTAPNGAVATVWNVKAHEYAKIGKHHKSAVETEQFILNEHYFRSPAYPKRNGTDGVQTECHITTDEDDAKDDDEDDDNDDNGDDDDDDDDEEKTSSKSSEKSSSHHNNKGNSKRDSKNSSKSDSKKSSKSDGKKSSKSDGNMKQAVCVRKSINHKGHAVHMTHTYHSPKPFVMAHVEYTQTTSSSSQSSTQTISATAAATATGEADLVGDVVVVTQTVGATGGANANSQFSQQGASSPAMTLSRPKTAQILVVSTVLLPALLTFVFAI